MKLSRPWRVVAAENLSNYGLTRTQILVGRALLDFAIQSRLEAFPNLTTLANRVAMTERGVRKVLRVLESSGAIERTRVSRGGCSRNGRGIPNHWTLTFAVNALTLNPHCDAADGESEAPTQSRPDRTGDNPERRSGLVDPEPGSERSRTRNGATDYPEQRSVEASTHEVTREPPLKPATQFLPFEMDGCQDRSLHEEPDLRQRLLRLRVTGENLERLLKAPGLTAALIERESISVSNDRSVRSHAAVLVKRLAQQLGIELKTRPSLSPRESNNIRRIEELRRKCKLAHEAATFGPSDLAHRRRTAG